MAAFSNLVFPVSEREASEKEQERAMQPWLIAEVDAVGPAFSPRLAAFLFHDPGQGAPRAPEGAARVPSYGARGSPRLWDDVYEEDDVSVDFPRRVQSVSHRRIPGDLTEPALTESTLLVPDLVPRSQTTLGLHTRDMLPVTSPSPRGRQTGWCINASLQGDKIQPGKWTAEEVDRWCTPGAPWEEEEVPLQGADPSRLEADAIHSGKWAAETDARQSLQSPKHRRRRSSRSRSAGRSGSSRNSSGVGRDKREPMSGVQHGRTPPVHQGNALEGDALEGPVAVFLKSQSEAGVQLQTGENTGRHEGGTPPAHQGHAPKRGASARGTHLESSVATPKGAPPQLQVLESWQDAAALCTSEHPKGECIGSPCPHEPVHAGKDARTPRAAAVGAQESTASTGTQLVAAVGERGAWGLRKKGAASQSAKERGRGHPQAKGEGQQHFTAGMAAVQASEHLPRDPLQGLLHDVLDPREGLRGPPPGGQHGRAPPVRHGEDLDSCALEMLLKEARALARRRAKSGGPDGGGMGPCKDRAGAKSGGAAANSGGTQRSGGTQKSGGAQKSGGPAEAAAVPMMVSSLPVERLHERYKFEGLLGEGQYGKVWRCLERVTGTPYACKEMSKREHAKAAYREVDCFLRVQPHPNIVNVEDVYEDDVSIMILMELCSEGDLFRHVCDGGMHEGQARVLFRQIVDAVCHCHARGVLHRDIKPENVLLQRAAAPSTPSSTSSTLVPGTQFTVKLADFGLAVALDPGGSLTGNAGTFPYQAPEVVKRQPYCFSADIWSLGIALYGMLSGCWPEFPQGHTFVPELEFNEPGWAAVSREARALICLMLQMDPQRRPSVEQVLEHPWLTGACPRALQCQGGALGVPLADLYPRAQSPLCSEQRDASAPAPTPELATGSDGAQGAKVTDSCRDSRDRREGKSAVGSLGASARHKGEGRGGTPSLMSKGMEGAQGQKGAAPGVDPPSGHGSYKQRQSCGGPADRDDGCRLSANKQMNRCKVSGSTKMKVPLQLEGLMLLEEDVDDDVNIQWGEHLPGQHKAQSSTPSPRIGQRRRTPRRQGIFGDLLHVQEEADEEGAGGADEGGAGGGDKEGERGEGGGRIEGWAGGQQSPRGKEPKPWTAVSKGAHTGAALQPLGQAHLPWAATGTLVSVSEKVYWHPLGAPLRGASRERERHRDAVQEGAQGPKTPRTPKTPKAKASPRTPLDTAWDRESEPAQTPRSPAHTPRSPVGVPNAASKPAKDRWQREKPMHRSPGVETLGKAPLSEGLPRECDGRQPNEAGASEKALGTGILVISPRRGAGTEVESFTGAWEAQGQHTSESQEQDGQQLTWQRLEEQQQPQQVQWHHQQQQGHRASGVMHSWLAVSEPMLSADHMDAGWDAAGIRTNLLLVSSALHSPKVDRDLTDISNRPKSIAQETRRDPSSAGGSSRSNSNGCQVGRRLSTEFQGPRAFKGRKELGGPDVPSSNAPAHAQWARGHGRQLHAKGGGACTGTLRNVEDVSEEDGKDVAGSESAWALADLSLGSPLRMRNNMSGQPHPRESSAFSTSEASKAEVEKGHWPGHGGASVSCGQQGAMLDTTQHPQGQQEPMQGAKRQGLGYLEGPTERRNGLAPAWAAASAGLELERPPPNIGIGLNATPGIIASLCGLKGHGRRVRSSQQQQQQ